MNTNDQQSTPVIITVRDIPVPSPCCVLPHEQGFRRGFAKGYAYALWDVSSRLTGAMWDKAQAFLEGPLQAWWQASHRMSQASVTRTCPG